MQTTQELRFEKPTFFKRLKSMLGVDFYRLFHTPMFYIFIAVAAFIPALVSMGATGGDVKQLFTTHAKKEDYMMSKTLVGAFSMVCMCVTYLIGGVVSAAFTGLPFSVDAGSLVIAILGKMIMSLGWASLYTFINAIFRSRFGISIALCFVLGTGIPVIGAAALVGNSPALDIFLYGSSVYACLSSNVGTLFVCLACSVAWTVIYNVLGSLVLYKTDVY